MTPHVATVARPQAQDPHGTPPHADPAAVRRSQLESTELLQGNRCVEIRHNGEVYRQQSTRLGKLILTK